MACSDECNINVRFLKGENTAKNSEVKAFLESLKIHISYRIAYSERHNAQRNQAGFYLNNSYKCKMIYKMISNSTLSRIDQIRFSKYKYVALPHNYHSILGEPCIITDISQ